VGPSYECVCTNKYHTKRSLRSSWQIKISLCILWTIIGWLRDLLNDAFSAALIVQCRIPVWLAQDEWERKKETSGRSSTLSLRSSLYLLPIFVLNQLTYSLKLWQHEYIMPLDATHQYRPCKWFTNSNDDKAENENFRGSSGASATEWRAGTQVSALVTPSRRSRRSLCYQRSCLMKWYAKSSVAPAPP
jgi:hypothetical protein